MNKTRFFPFLSIVLTASLLMSCNNGGNTETTDSKSNEPSTPTEGKVIQLSKADFLKNVFDYENNQQWKYKGDQPAIIDFYADWCKPCKMVAPIMEELAKEYKGKIHIYKVNTDMEQELAGAFNIQSIPAVLFVPQAGQPQMSVGALPKEEYVKVIETMLLPSATQQ